MRHYSRAERPQSVSAVGSFRLISDIRTTNLDAVKQTLRRRCCDGPILLGEGERAWHT
jgi:hypothetical protein